MHHGSCFHLQLENSSGLIRIYIQHVHNDVRKMKYGNISLSHISITSRKKVLFLTNMDGWPTGSHHNLIEDLAARLRPLHLHIDEALTFHFLWENRISVNNFLSNN